MPNGLPKRWYQFTFPPALESSFISSPTLDIVSCLGYSGRCFLIPHWDFNVHIPGDRGWMAFYLLIGQLVGCPVLQRSCSNIVPSFHCVVLFSFWILGGTVLYSVHETSVGYVCCRPLSPILRFIFWVSKCVFWWTEVLILMKSKVSMFPFIVSAFRVCFQDLCLSQSHKDFVHMWFSISLNFWN